VVGSATILLAYALGVTDPLVIVALGVIVGFVPAAITWVVVNVRKSRKPPPAP
jgi:thiol:disulfide interchange protein